MITGNLGAKELGKPGSRHARVRSGGVRSLHARRSIFRARRPRRVVASMGDLAFVDDSPATEAVASIELTMVGHA